MKKLLIILGAIIATTPVIAQEEDDNILFGSWEMGYSTSSYLKDYSFAGGRFDYRHFISDNISIGLGMSWNTYEEYRDAETYTSKDGNTAIHSDILKTVYQLPITASAHYYFTKENKLIVPFIGINMGAQYSEQNAYINIFQFYDENWGFVARPELGLYIDTEGSVLPYFSVGYNMSTNKNADFNVTSFEHFTFNIGLAVCLD